MPPQILSLVLALFVGAAPGAPGPAAVTSARVARLEVRLDTSASVTVVRLNPGRFVADRVVSKTPGIAVESSPTGWTVRGGKRGASVRLRAVLEEPTLASSFRLRLRTSSGGGATMQVVNTSRSHFQVASLRATPSAPDRTIMLGRRAVLGGAEPAVRRADARKLVLAAYHPWYGTNYSSPKLADRPSNPRHTRSPAGVLDMTRQAASAGIDGFVVSWAGAAQNGAGFDLALRAAERTGTVATAYLEAQAARSPQVAARWLDEALRRSASPAFLKSGGVPVVFVFRMNTLRPTGWKWVLDELRARGRRVKLVGDAGLQAYGSVEWGFHQYSPNGQTPEGNRLWNRRSVAEARLLADGPAKAFVATVSPGFDNRRAVGPSGKYVARGTAGERYAAIWEAALASNADWILVTSWNEWFEGTAVEPSIGAGDLALRQTTSFAARFTR